MTALLIAALRCESKDGAMNAFLKEAAAQMLESASQEMERLRSENSRLTELNARLSRKALDKRQKQIVGRWPKIRT